MNNEKYLKFLLDNTMFAIKIEYVEEILHIPKITEIPLTQDYILGLSNLRGNIIPIIDLKKRIKESNINFTELSRIIVVNINNQKTGLLIEAIKSIEEVDSDKIKNAEDYEGINSDFLQGIFESEDDNLVGIINLEKILEIKTQKKVNKNSILNNNEKDNKDTQVIEDIYSKKILTFNLGDQTFSIDIDFCREIIEKPEIEEIPTNSDDIIGVFNLRDEIIPILNLKKKLEIQTEMNKNEEHIDKIIIFIHNNIVLGLLVDEVNEVITPYKTEILEVPKTFNEISKKYVKSIFNRKDSKKIIFILNENTIITDKELEDLNSIKKEKKEVRMSDESEEKKIAVFKLDEEEFGIFIEEINEINRLPDITSVPKSAEFIEGIINLRGEIIPVINLRERLGLKRKEFDEFERVIIIEIENQKTGLIVDRVTEIKSILKNQFKDVPDFLKTNIEKDVMNSIVNLEDENRIITMISTDKILTKKEKTEFKKLNISKKEKTNKESKPKENLKSNSKKKLKRAK